MTNRYFYNLCKNQPINDRMHKNEINHFINEIKIITNTLSCITSCKLNMIKHIFNVLSIIPDIDHIEDNQIINQIYIDQSLQNYTIVLETIIYNSTEGKQYIGTNHIWCTKIQLKEFLTYLYYDRMTNHFFIIDSCIFISSCIKNTIGNGIA